MTKDNEDALRCAHGVERMDTFTDYQRAELLKCAAHLRRLVRENEFLSRALAARNIEVVHAAQQLNAKDALLRQAVEALEEARTFVGAWPAGAATIAAIRKHLDQKTT